MPGAMHRLSTYLTHQLLQGSPLMDNIPYSFLMHFKEHIKHATTGVFTYQIHPPLHLLLTQLPLSFTHLQNQAHVLPHMKMIRMVIQDEQPV